MPVQAVTNQTVTGVEFALVSFPGHRIPFQSLVRCEDRRLAMLREQVREGGVQSDTAQFIRRYASKMITYIRFDLY